MKTIYSYIYRKIIENNKIEDIEFFEIITFFVFIAFTYFYYKIGLLKEKTHQSTHFMNTFVDICDILVVHMC